MSGAPRSTHDGVPGSYLVISGTDGPPSVRCTGPCLFQFGMYPAMPVTSHDSLRFFYTAPAMSQIYTELERLHDAGLVLDRAVQDGNRTIRSYRLSARGAAALRTWAAETGPEPPVLKHHLALRLFLGHLVEPE